MRSFKLQATCCKENTLKSNLHQLLTTLPKEGVKKVLVVCPAFVSDCLETLEEMGEEGKETFLHAGGESFTLIPCLNVHPLWVKTLAHYVNAETEMLIKDGK